MSLVGFSDLKLPTFRVSVAEAWQQWREASCIEWNGGHPWELEICEGQASLACGYCATTHPALDYSNEFLTMSPTRVRLTEHSETYGNPMVGIEHDFWLEVTPL